MSYHDHRVIFIHIPKTGGSSLAKKLGRLKRDHRSVRAIRPVSLWRHGRYLLDPDVFRADWMSRKSVLMEMLGLQVDERRATREQFASYFKFAVVRNPWDRVYSWYRNVMRDPKHGIPPCDLRTFLIEHGQNWALRPQMHWITDFDGSIPLDRIVRFERLQEEADEILGALGFPDTTLPEVLVANNPSYRSGYDDETAELVADRYREEIELFGYAF